MDENEEEIFGEPSEEELQEIFAQQEADRDPLAEEDRQRALWTYMVGEVPSDAVIELIRFSSQHVANPENRSYRLYYSLDFWFAYLFRVHLQCDRYREMARAYDDASETFWGPRPVPDDITYRLHGSEMRLELEIESFYVAAKLLLERIATTFCFYFLRTIPKRYRGSMHSLLTTNFRDWNKEISGDENSHPALSNLIFNLKEHIVSFRNVHIEHPRQPDSGVKHVFVNKLENGFQYYSASARSEEGRMVTGPPTVFVLTLENYIGEMVRYFRRYHSSSIFRDLYE